MLEGLPKVRDISECLPFFRMIFDSIQIGIMVADQYGELIYYNQAQSEIDRLRPEEVLGRGMCEVYNFTLDASPAMQVLRSGEAIVDKVHSYLTRSGNLVNGSCTIYPLSAAGGDIIGVICYSQSYLTLDRQLQNAQRDIGLLKESAAARGNSAKESHYSFSSLIGNNKSLLAAVDLARVAAGNSSAVMLVGETGVGKEIFAQSIHYDSSRAGRPYTAINCSAVPEALLEGILFGTVRGAFTGAMNKPGLFEVSDGGTIFLDEVDSMPVSLQSKLLRVLQEKRVRRVGDAQERAVDVRIISAVGRNPAQLVKDGFLRPDFYYRLGVIKIFLPPLRERMDDLPLLLQHFLVKFSEAAGRRVPLLMPEVTSMLYAHDWPGNVRELEHAVEAALSIMGPALTMEASHLRNACPEVSFGRFSEIGNGQYSGSWDAKWDASGGAGFVKDPNSHPAVTQEGAPGAAWEANVPKNPDVQDVRSGHNGPNGYNGLSGGRLSAVRQEAEAASIREALRSAAGNRSLAARLLGISPQLMYYKMKKYRLDAVDFAPRLL